MPGAEPTGMTCQATIPFPGFSGDLHKCFALRLAVFKLNVEDFEFAPETVTREQRGAKISESFGEWKFLILFFRLGSSADQVGAIIEDLIEIVGNKWRGLAPEVNDPFKVFIGGRCRILKDQAKLLELC